MKILILRFSSIGDIVLTTPVIRMVKQQVPRAVVHFATKPAYRSILASNPYVDKVHTLSGSLMELAAELRAEKFDYIIDLHNNLRTTLLKVQLGVKSSSFNKLNIRKWILTKLGTNLLPRVHIVERYLAAAAPLGVQDDEKGLDYFIPAEDEIDVRTLPTGFQQGYVAFAIGGQHATKRLPTERIIELCRLLKRPIVLLGGPEDEATGRVIAEAFGGDTALRSAAENQLAGAETAGVQPAGLLVYNACGKLSLNQSASVLRQAELVASHDTGLMHIAAAFQKEIYSIWGNTIPEFGMYPYRTDFKLLEVQYLACRPCSKIGYDQCPKGHFKCMRDIYFEFYMPLPPEDRWPGCQVTETNL